MQPDIDRQREAKARARRQHTAQVQRRRLVFFAGVVVLLVLIIVLAARSCGGDDGSGASTTGSTTAVLPSAIYTADLTGADSVPAVTTQATAVLTLDYDSAAKEMAFTLELTYQISNASVATIGKGLPGEDGATVYTLFAGPAKEGNFDGILAQGTIAADDLTGPLQGGTIADLIALIEDGEAYVSIGNESHPIDAIRGPITAE